ncbi:MAG: hypothetical protein IAF08_02040 [Rhizobacter sp.]|nr:hypothetical protein [Chlorobiales bacterium]
MDSEDILSESKNKIRQGASPDDIITYLHVRKFTIAESIKAVRHLYALPLGEAKQLVAMHPAWKDVDQATAEFHRELIETLKTDKDTAFPAEETAYAKPIHRDSQTP